MNTGPRILSLQHGQTGLLEGLLACAVLLFSAEERARYRRLANATALLRLSMASGGGDDDGTVIRIRKPQRLGMASLAGLALLATVALVAWHFTVDRPVGAGSASSSGVHRC